MATRKKPAQRRKSKKKGAGKSGSMGGIGLRVLVSLTLVVVLMAGLWFWAVREPGPVEGRGEWIETVLVSGQVSIKDDVRKVEKDGVERWRVSVPDRDKKNALIQGLRQMSASQDLEIEVGKEQWRQGKALQLVEFPEFEGHPLRIIFVVEGNSGQTQVARKDKTPSKPKVTPKTQPTPAKPKTSVPAEKPQPQVAQTHPEPSEFGLFNPEGSPRVAIILDDIGFKPVESLNPVLELKLPITFAVIPHLKYGPRSAVWFHQNHYEVMLHMPMEPNGYPKNDPGEGAVLSNFNEEEIRAAMNSAFENVPFISGVNNHMGSKITANRALMRTVLEECRKRQLFYIDSRTESNSVAFSLAKTMGLRTAVRHVFLDSEDSYEFVKKQLQEVRQVAVDHGIAVVIGHPYPGTLKALKEEMPLMDQEGYRFVFASEIVVRYSDASGTGGME